ncbi:MAG: hypothetical protein U0234_27205 [Sandaracinus sp.]
MSARRVPLWAHALVVAPRAVEQSLARIAERGLAERVPTVTQIALGVARMQVRVLTRPETVGMCTDHPVRRTWRARLLAARPLRFPFLLREKAIAPLDFSGLASSRERILRHLLGAHHDGAQFVYDLELLEMYPGALEELRDRARAVVDGSDPRAAWLRDLCVFEGYHEALLAVVEDVIANGRLLDRLPPEVRRDPDITLEAYLAWCARQPTTLGGALAALLDGSMTFAAYRAASEAA